jgi:hypothetical protein
MSGKKFIYGVGINNADYAIKKYEELPRINGKQNQKVIWRCPFYTKWMSMLKRCYSENYKDKRPTYKDVTCCDEWLTFSNFKSWMETQDWEGKELDKDLLVYKNKVYSPETCCFIPREVNLFLTKSSNSRGLYPLGVSRMVKQKDPPLVKAKPFESRVSKGSVSNFLGYYETPEQAHKAWQKAKIERAEVLKKEQTDIRIISGLQRIINKIQYDCDNNLETIDF